MIFFAGIFLLVLTVLSYGFFKELLAPAVAFPLVWAFIAILHPLCQLTILPDLYSISTQTVLVILGGNLFFVAGALVYDRFKSIALDYQQADAGKTNIGFQNSAPLITIPTSTLIRIFLLVIVFGLLPVYINLSLSIVLQSGAEEVLSELRTELILGEIDIGPIKYMQPFSIVTYGFCEVEALKNPRFKNKLFAILGFIAAFIYALFSTGRTFFFILILLFLGLRTILKENFSLARNFWIFPLVIIAFGFYGLVYNKGGSTEQPILESIEGIAEITAIYIVTPVTAFDLVTQPPFEPSFDGYRVFRFFYLVGNSLGITEVPKDYLTTIKEFINVPYEGNVFTVFGPYSRDFGIMVAFPFLFLIGWLHTYLYRMAIATRYANLSIYYSLLLYPLIMSFFDDQYVTSLSLWLQIIFMIEFIALLNRIHYSFGGKP